MSSTAYRAYVSLLVTLMTVLPLTLGAVDEIAQPHVARAITTKSAAVVVTILAGVLLSLIMLLGSVRGPVMGSPFQINVRVASPKRRSRSLASALFKSGLAALLVISYLSGVVILGLFRAGAISSALAGSLMFAVFSFSIVFVSIWMIGQVLGRRSWLLAWLPLAVCVFAPPNFISLIGLCGAAGLAIVFFPRLLNSLYGPVVVAQAQRWQGARTSLYIGDTAGAFALYGPLPGRGRQWRAVVVRPTWWRVFRADFIGAVRTLGAFVLSLIGLVSGMSLLLIGVAASSRWGSAVAAGGTILGYFALGPLTARFKYIASLRQTPAVFGFSTAQLFGLHAIFPAVTGLIFGLGVASIAAWSFSSFWTASRTVLIALTILLGLRGYSSAKREMPLILLTPVESPVGDLSSLNVLLWQADAALLAGAAGAALALI